MEAYNRSKQSKAHAALAKKFYKSKAWRVTRESYFNKQYGLCERCGGAGKIVHHIEYIDMSNIDDPDILLSHDNLELLCQTCHNREHFQHDAMAEGYSFDADGELVYNGKGTVV